MDYSDYQATDTSGSALSWRRALACNSGNCVEVAITDERVVVRDGTGAGSSRLSFTHDEWRTFVGAVRDGEFDLP